jgi:hypothetical protein
MSLRSRLTRLLLKHSGSTRAFQYRKFNSLIVECTILHRPQSLAYSSDARYFLRKWYYVHPADRMSRSSSNFWRQNFCIEEGCWTFRSLDSNHPSHPQIWTCILECDDTSRAVLYWIESCIFRGVRLGTGNQFSPLEYYRVELTTFARQNRMVSKSWLVTKGRAGTWLSNLSRGWGESE